MNVIAISWLKLGGYIVCLAYSVLLIQTAKPKPSLLDEIHRSSSNVQDYIIHGGFHGNNNNTIPLDDLKKIFHPPNCSDIINTCQTLHATEVSDYLTHRVNRSVERLCLMMQPNVGESWKEVEIHLNSLILLTSLKKLWIIPAYYQQYTAANRFRIFYPRRNYTQKLPIQEVHINLPIRGTGLDTFAPFIQTLDKLRVLNLAHTLQVNKDNELNNILRALEGKQIVALSLRSFQSMAFDLTHFIEYLNATNLLWPLKDCPLQHLDLSQNDILGIFPGIYTVTNKLRILDVSNNNMISTTHKAVWVELFLHPSIEILNINNQGHRNEYQSMTTAGKQPTEMDNGNTGQMLTSSFLHDLEKCKHKLGLNDTEEKIKHNFCELLYCANPLRLKGIPCAILPSWHDLFPINFTCMLYIVIPPAKRLKEITMANFNIPVIGKKITAKSTLCLGPNSLEEITISNDTSFVKGLNAEEFMKNTHILGLEKVTHLDLSNNGLRVPLQNMMDSFPLLQYLHLGGNLVSINNPNICKSYKFLKLLDLRNNNLTRLSLNLRKCQTFEDLDVSGNNLEDIDHIEMSTINSLKGSNNRITKLGKQTMMTLKNLGKKHPVKIDLSNNPWYCGCSKEAIKSIDFMQTALNYNITFTELEHYQCYGIRGYSLLVAVNVAQLNRHCYPSKLLPYIETVIVTTAATVVLLMFYLCYRCRFRINTCYFHTCQHVHNKNKAATSTTTIKYDAFVSYAADDRFWVHDVLMPELEGNCGLKLCLHYRDFPACGDIVDVIVDQIKQSNSIVVVLSRFSVVNHWCDYELKHAHAQHLCTGKDLIIIKLGDIPNDLEVTDLVQDLLNSKVYVEWPDVGHKPSDSDRRRQSVFWSKIQKAIYGRDYCECFRYCNPLYKRNDPLRASLLQHMD